MRIKKKQIQNAGIVTAIIVSVTLVIIFIVVGIEEITRRTLKRLHTEFPNSPSNTIAPDDFDMLSAVGQFAGFLAALVGILFSIIGVVFLYITFHQQRKTFKRERFENQFFEMMKIYRENVSEMHFLPSDQKKANSFYTGRKVFSKINKEFLKLFDSLSEYSRRNSITINEEDLIGITNTTLFFGLENESLNTLDAYYERYGYKEKYKEIVKYILTEVTKERAKYKKKFKYYGGHQVRLGHYFRHLYQTVLFVHNQKFLTLNEKYGYIKLLRGQMGTVEQAVFFYNAVSPFGAVWELKYRDQCYTWKLDPVTRKKHLIEGREVQTEDLLITQYRLIQNIPEGFTGSINPRTYFSKMKFEGDED